MSDELVLRRFGAAAAVAGLHGGVVHRDDSGMARELAVPVYRWAEFP